MQVVMLQAARGRDVGGVTPRDERLPGGQGSCTSEEEEGPGAVEGTQHLSHCVR